MDVNALRTWGIAVSGALMVGALALATQPSPPAEARQALEPGGFEIAMLAGSMLAAAARMAQAARPPHRPAQVLPGETAGASFRTPQARPAK